MKQFLQSNYYYFLVPLSISLLLMGFTKPVTDSFVSSKWKIFKNKIYQDLLLDKENGLTLTTKTLEHNNEKAVMLTVTTTTTPVSIAGGTDGTATANPTGGTAPYTYAWSTTPSQFTQTANLLMAGTYTVTVTDALAATTTATAVVTEPTVNLSITATTNGAEPSTNGVFTVSLSESFLTDVVVNYTVSGTAQQATDYNILPGIVTIPAGSLSAPITVAVVDDVIQEPSETVIVTLTGVTPPQIQMPIAPNDTATITIEDNENGTLSVDNVTITEGPNGSSTDMIFTVTLSGTLADDASVDYSTSNLTALAGMDYIATTGTLLFPAGSPDGTTRTFAVPVLGDLLVESVEQFDVQLSNINTALPIGEIQISDDIGEGTILDAASTSIGIGDASVTEGSTGGTTSMQFTITVTGDPSVTPIVVTYNTVNGTAENENGAGDYQSAVGQTVTIPAGATSATFDITINSDTQVEEDENFTVLIASAGTTVGDNLGVGTIINDDYSPIITNNVSDPSATYTYTENDVTPIDDFDATDGNFETENGGGLTWSISGGVDAAAFAIDAGGLLTFVAAPDFENPVDGNLDNDYEVQVTISDVAGNTDVQTLLITVEDTNEAPEITSDGGGATAAISAAENQTAVTTVVAADLDAADAVSYSITGGADQALFTIDLNSGVLTFNAAPDFENPTDTGADNGYELTVTATDLGGLTDMQDLTITVTNVNEAPVITSANTASVVENSTGVVINIESTDDTNSEGSGLTYSFLAGGADNGAFTLDGNTGDLSFATSPDFEAPTDADTNNDYLVAVEVCDAGGLCTTQNITITVTNVNEAPVITSANTASVAENSSGVVINVESTDDTNAEGAGLSYSFEASGVDNSAFTLSASTGDLSFVASPDFEAPTDADTNNEYLVAVQVCDAGALCTIQNITITVTNVNEAPVIISANTASFPENTTGVVLDIESTDDTNSEGVGLTYGFVAGGVDNGSFNLDAISGELTFVASPDFENPTDGDTNNDYEISIEVCDAGGLCTPQSIIVSVSDENDAPTITSALTASFAEDGTGVAIDVQSIDDNDTEGTGLTYSLLTGGADNGLFTIDTNNGEVTFNTPPDFENPTDADANNEYLIAVQVCDVGGLCDTQNIAISVTDGNDAPVFINYGGAATGTAIINENVAVVEDFNSVDDTDAETSGITYSIAGVDAALFAIDTSSGVLSFISTPNYEDPQQSGATDNEYLVDVIATDSGGANSVISMTILVEDVCESTSPAISQ